MPTYCVPVRSSVPGSPAIFDWWSTPPVATNLQYFPDNPDWLGAFSLSGGGAGATRDYQFRALQGVVGVQNYLFLSWVVRVSSLNMTIEDRVNIVLGDGTNYLAFQANLATGSGPIIAGTENNSVFTYQMHTCNVSGVNLVPGTGLTGSEIEDTGRMWVAVNSPGRNIPTLWAFQIAIPLGGAWGTTALNLPASGAFKLWYEVFTSIGGAATARYSVPGGTTATSNTADIIPPGPGGLPLAQLVDMSTNLGGTCDQAVSLNYWSCGTRNVAVTDPPRGGDQNTIRLDLGQPYPPLQATAYNESIVPNVSSTPFQNQFFAQPTFPVGFTDPQKTSVRATFSLANWGSQYEDNTANSWRPIPGGTGVQYQVGAINEARFVWPSGGAADAFTTTFVRNINRFLNHLRAGTTPVSPAQNPHQCMLIELSSSDSSVVMTNSSTYSNMNIANASTFRRFAEISVVGIPPIGPQRRDVYLFLQTFNMPPVVQPGGGNGNGNGDDGPGVNNAAGLNPFAMNLKQTSAVGKQPLRDVEDVANFFPTYTVHAFHDTGKKMTLADGRKVPILEAQTGFGYFAAHDGPLVGWDARLYGAEKLDSNLYVVRVPNNGSVLVETALQARETPSDAPLPPDDVVVKPPDKCKGCLAALLCFLKKLFGG